MQKLLLMASWFVAGAADLPVTISKCCPFGEFYTERTVCEKTAKEWSPLVVTSEFTRQLNQTEVSVLLGKWTVKVSRPKCKNEEVEEFVRLDLGATRFLLLDNGSLWFENNFLPPELFCLDDNSAILCSKREVLTTASPDAPPGEQVKLVHVKKCCDSNELYSHDLSACSVSSNARPATLAQFVQHTASQSIVNVSNTFFAKGFPDCKEGFIITGKLSEHNSTLLQNGSLHLPTAKTVLQPKSFCLEYIDEEPGNFPSIFTCPDFLSSPAKGSHIAPERGDIRLTLYPWALLISVFFLAATLVAGYFLPTTHHMLHWRCQTCHVACLMIADFFLAVTQIAGDSFSKSVCISFAILMHFLFLAAFFWLNTMCFNIWWTFRDLRPTSLDKSQEAWRLRMYEIYAWGVPLLIATLAVIFDQLPQGNFPSVLKPKFAVKSCWFHDDLEIFAYFFGPVGILLLLNLILFAMTARELTCGLWRSEMVKSTTERATLGKVCLKLVVVMGITWIADVVSWAVKGQSIWYVVDIVNALQGVFIFIVVGCQPQTCATMRRLLCFRGTAAVSVNGNQQSCSQDVPSIGDSTINNTQNTSVKTLVGETLC